MSAKSCWAVFQAALSLTAPRPKLGPMHPSKRRGFRPITVGGTAFSWRLRPGAKQSTLVVRSSDSSGQALIVTLSDWRDPWLNISGFDVNEDGMQVYTSAVNQPASITAAFVRQAIEAALKRGWDPEARSQPFALEYRGGAFSVSDQVGG